MTREEIQMLRFRTRNIHVRNLVPKFAEQFEELCDYALEIMDQLAAKDAAYTALLAAMEACRKGREEAERERHELRKILEAAEGR